MSRLKEKLLGRLLESHRELAESLLGVGVVTVAATYGRGFSLCRFLDAEGDNTTLSFADPDQKTLDPSDVFLLLQKVLEIIDPYSLHHQQGEIIWKVGWCLYIDHGEQYEIALA